MGPLTRKQRERPSPAHQSMCWRPPRYHSANAHMVKATKKARLVSTRIQWLFMMKPSMVPSAMTDQSAAVPEPNTRLASRPVNSSVPRAQRAPTKRNVTVMPRVSCSRASKGMARM